MRHIVRLTLILAASLLASVPTPALSGSPAFFGKFLSQRRAAAPAKALKITPEASPAATQTTPDYNLPRAEFKCPKQGEHILDCWLSLHPEVADTIEWKMAENGFYVGWSQWDEAHKSDLRTAFDAYVKWHKAAFEDSHTNGFEPLHLSAQNNPALLTQEGAAFQTSLSNASSYYHGAYHGFEFSDPIPNETDLTDDQSPVLRMNEQTAWTVYRSYTAFSLAAEIHAWLPWSLLTDDDKEMRSLFLYSSGVQPFLINNPSDPSVPPGSAFFLGNYDVTPAPPTFVYSFLKSHDLIRETPLETVGAVVRWMKDFSHILGGSPNAQGAEYIWGFRGPPPMSRIMNGTHLTDPKDGPAYPGIRHWIHMCQGSTNFLVWLLRLVNIPDDPIFVCGHATSHFPTVNRYLTHGDDPYNSYNRSLPDFPGTELLIDENKFQEWFGDGPLGANTCKNVGRQTYELALKNIPDRMVDDYCEDVSAGKSQADGSIMKDYQDWYTFQDLGNMGVWDKLTAKAQSEGKCQPPTP